ncbi:protein SPMIP7 [Amia ocellicauda]|uniref:protein SPMIP7 n=1 Tax=Amia ocellicauda TaxID=2972642 RepID=UPI003464125B
MRGVCTDPTPLPGACNPGRLDCSALEKGRMMKQRDLPMAQDPGDSFQEKKGSPDASSHGLGDSRASAPLRGDAFGGQRSAGAAGDLMTEGRSRQGVFDPSERNGPAEASRRPQTPPVRPSALTPELSPDKRWNSRAVSAAAVRARLGGWTSPARVAPQSPCNHFSFEPEPTTEVSNAGPSLQCRDLAAKRYIYTSSTQRSYEEVEWDTKLPPRFKPPSSTQERMADPVNQHFTLKRYDPVQEYWQAVGSLWDRLQLRIPNIVRKPVTFVSPCPRTGQIPSYSGTIGAENLDEVDNPDADFLPFTVLRTVQPQYTDTAHRPNIPGYTGRIHFKATHPANSNLPSPPTSAQAHGYIPTSGNFSPHRHLGPLSRMVTTVSPYNPFQSEKREVVQA